MDFLYSTSFKLALTGVGVNEVLDPTHELISRGSIQVIIYKFKELIEK